MLPADTTMSKMMEASVGAPGTNDRNLGWSTEMQVGAKISV